MVNTAYQKNVAYLFIPFAFEKQEHFNPLIDALDADGLWQRWTGDDKGYMFKYIADKINGGDVGSCQCRHFQLAEEKRESFGLGAASDWFSTVRPRPFGGVREPIRFRILDVQLFCFRTSVCILAFMLHFEKDDPFFVAHAEFYLKNAARERFRLDDAERSATLLEFSEALTARLKRVSALDFFYYANEDSRRANVLTYLEVEDPVRGGDGKPDEDERYFRRELFYLKRCYRESYTYTKKDSLDSEENYVASEDRIWGISPEAAVCLACPERGDRAFLRSTFYPNFNTRYLFMYVLVLHQKYVLYKFLTDIGVGAYNDLETLERYRAQLYEFETNFVFSCVTEVPQYQLLYEKMTQAFSLKKLYEDVREPLISLAEVRRAADEKAQRQKEEEQQKRDLKINKALFWLSALSVFSALVDSFDFIDSFVGWFAGPVVVKVVQLCCIALILWIGYKVFRLSRGPKKRGPSTDQKGSKRA